MAMVTIKKHFGLKSKMSAVVTEFGVHETKHEVKNNRYFSSDEL